MASADDDADLKRINAKEFTNRLRFLLTVIELGFSDNLHSEIKQVIPKSLFASCNLDDLGFSVLRSSDLSRLISKSAPLPHTKELFVNTFGAWLFGCTLSNYIEMLYRGGMSPRRLVYLVEQVATQLKVGVEGQIQSLGLVSSEPIPFSCFLSLTQSLSAPIAKILTYLRSPDHSERLRKHFKRFDPTVFQYVLDDIPDLFEDCFAGKQGIVHGLIFAQQDIAKLADAAISTNSHYVDVSDLSALRFLQDGDWSTASNYDARKDKILRVKVTDLRPALENRRRDKHLTLEELVSTRMKTGEHLISALRTRDLRECGTAVIESGILSKIVTGLRKDQRRVNHIHGVTSKMVGLLPLVTALIAVRCYALAWRYRMGWRVQ